MCEGQCSIRCLHSSYDICLHEKINSDKSCFYLKKGEIKNSCNASVFAQTFESEKLWLYTSGVPPDCPVTQLERPPLILRIFLFSIEACQTHPRTTVWTWMLFWVGLLLSNWFSAYSNLNHHSGQKHWRKWKIVWISGKYFLQWDIRFWGLVLQEKEKLYLNLQNEIRLNARKCMQGAIAYCSL